MSALLPAVTSRPVEAPRESRDRRPAAPSRLGWVDTAKGAAILLVVLFHAAKILEDAGLVGEAWIQVNRVVSVFRMPLFFAVSGVFVASVVRRPWTALWRSRLSVLLWAFAVWTLVRFGYYAAVPLESRPEEHDPARLVQALWAPPTGLWFLFALAAFTVLAKLTRRVPLVIQVAVAAGVSGLVRGPVALPYETWDRMAVYYVFFVAALLYGPALRQYVARSTGADAALWWLLLGAGGAAIVLLGQGWLTLPLGFVAVLAGTTLARQVEATTVGQSLAGLGGQTLPIYVVHVLALSGFTSVLLAHGGAVTGSVHEVWLPLALTAAATAVSLLVWDMLLRTPARVLFAPPAWFRGR